MSKMIELGENFAEFIGEGVAVVDFWAKWCGPCRAIAPMLDDLADELGEVKFGKVNVDDYPELAGNYQVSSIPNICIFKNGELVDRIVGAQPRDVFVEKITKA